MWNLVAGEDYSSFNRYMVECESFNSVTAACVVTCFNRYMVECE